MYLVMGRGIGFGPKHHCAPDAVEYVPAAQKVHTESFTAPATALESGPRIDTQCSSNNMGWAEKEPASHWLAASQAKRLNKQLSELGSSTSMGSSEA